MVSYRPNKWYRMDLMVPAQRIAGSLESATVLLSWGADVKGERRDGAGLIALAIHSKRPDSISFARRRGSERIASTFDARALARTQGG
jgi:hypothetical protein